MKFRILVTIAAVLCYASIACATAIPSAGTSLGTQSPTPYKPSSKVFMDAVSDTVHYAVTAQHQSAKGNGAKGGFQYGTTDGSPSLLRAAPTATDAPTSATQPNLPAAFLAF